MAHLFDTLHDYFLPHSRYSTSMKGLSWSQVVNSPLPPYLSPLPVIFRMLAYLVIAPVIVLLILDFGGYLVWRIYDQPFWSGTRTAFYKFRTSPVFTKSRTGSPTTSKVAQLRSYLSPEGKEASLSPVSSSGSLHEEVFGGGGFTDGAETSPPSPILSRLPDLPAPTTSEDLFFGRKHTTSTSDQPNEIKRSNSLGLGFEKDEQLANPLLSPSTTSEVPISPTSSSFVGEEGSPTSSSSNLDEDDKAFREAKAAISSQAGPSL